MILYTTYQYFGGTNYSKSHILKKIEGVATKKFETVL